MARKRHIPRHNQRGFTLVEVLVSLAILAVGILASAGFVVTTIEGNKAAKDLTTAVALTSEKLEEIEHSIQTPTDWRDIMLPMKDAVFTIEDWGSMTGYERFRRITRVSIGVNAHANTTEMALVRVQVAWKDKQNKVHFIWQSQYLHQPPGIPADELEWDKTP